MLAPLLLLLACGPGSAPTAPAEVAVAAFRTDTVQAARHRPSVELTGALEPLASVQLGFDVPGRVDALYVGRGQSVKAGERVARLDTALSAAQLAQAEAALEGARAQLAAGEAAWSRAQKLKEAGALSEQQYTDAQGGILAARAGVAQAEAAVRLARTHLSLHTLVSPIAGVITGAPDNPGMMVGGGTPLFFIEDVSALQVKTSAPESAAAWLQAGLAATVLPQTPGATEGHPGTVTRVLPSLDPRTRRLPVEVRIDAPPPSLKANGYARVRVEGPADVDAYSVPRGAVVARPEFAVFVAPGPTAKPVKVPVEVLSEAGERWVVSGNLKVGDTVIVDPPHSLEG